MSQSSQFLFKLVPPRPTFFADQTAEEQAVMKDHIDYWSHLVADGTAVAFGPVLDPAGVWGVAVIEVEDAQAAESIRANDPVVKAGIAALESHPMHGVVRPRALTAHST